MFDREKWGKRLRAILSLDSHPGHISAGFAVGVFISFTPFFGLHSGLAIAAAFIFRLNKLTCLTGSWLNSPLTVVPALGLSYKIGRTLRGLPPHDIVIKETTWTYLVHQHGASLLLGCAVTGFVAAIISYFTCYWLVVRFRRNDESQRALAEEMERVGEELK